MMNRQSLLMLVGAAVFAVIAVFVARAAFSARAAAPSPTAFNVVAATKPLAFGDKVTPDTLKLVALPLNAIPQGAFKKIDVVVGDGSRVAQRAIAENEIIVPTAISGTGNRLSTMGVIGGQMRAVTVNVTESSGVGGLVAPGDHVDVYITRTPPEKVPHYDVVAQPVAALPAAPAPGSIPAGAPNPIKPRNGAFVPTVPSLVRASAGSGDARPTPITDLLIQDVRVLAIGQNVNVSSEKPELVKSATLEVTPAQVAKLTLGQSVGTLALALRPLSDTNHTTVPSLHVEDLHDGPIHIAAEAPRVVRAKVHVHHEPVEAAPQIDIIRDGEATHYTVPGA